MKKKFFVVTAIIIGSQLQAQLAPISGETDTTAKALDEIILTANKYPNKTSLTGKVVTVITREQLEKSGGKDLAQLLTEQTGLIISGANSNAGKDKSIYLRGAGTEYTLITIDGVPVYDPSGISGNFDIRNLSISNIERIEILKGSQSTLYGSDAIAGVINIITRKNSAKKISTNGRTSYGSNASFRANAGVDGNSGIVDYHAAYSYYRTKGINETVNNTSLPADRDQYVQNSIQLDLGIKPTGKISIHPFFRYGNNKGDLDQGAFTDEMDYTYSQKSLQAGVRNEFSLGRKKLNVIYNYNKIDRLYIDDSVKSRNGYDIYSRGSYEGGEHFVDAYLHAPLSTQVKLTTGIDYRNSNTSQDYLSVSAFGPYTTSYSSDSLHQDQVGIYAAANWNHPSGFNMELGGRVNIHSEYGSYFVYNINPSYLLGRKIKFFANFSSAYRTPSLFQLYSEYGNKNLEPEAGLTAEGGLQYFSPGNNFTGRIVAFSRHVKDVTFFYFNSSTFQSQYINQDKQNDYGFELEASYTFAKKFLLKAFYTYTDGEITTVKNGKDTSFNNLLRRPKSGFGFNLSGKINKRLYVSSNLLAIGKRKDAYFDNTTFSTVQADLDSYLLWDVYAEYSFYENKLSLFADLRNVSNSRYTEVSGYNTLRFNGYGGIRFTF